jgi:hypothetical protein
MMMYMVSMYAQPNITDVRYNEERERREHAGRASKQGPGTET